MDQKLINLMNKNEKGKSCSMLSENTEALMTVYADYDWIRSVMVD